MFLKEFKSFIKNVDENTFKINKQSIINNLLKKQKQLKSKTVNIREK